MPTKAPVSILHVRLERRSALDAGFPFAAVQDAALALIHMAPVPTEAELDARFVVMTDHPYWLTDNGDMAAVLDGEAEEQRPGEPFGYAGQGIGAPVDPRPVLTAPIDREAAIAVHDLVVDAYLQRDGLPCVGAPSTRHVMPGGVAALIDALADLVYGTEAVAS